MEELKMKVDILTNELRDLKTNVYGKGELDRVFSAITDNTKTVKDMLEKHDAKDDQRFGKIEDRLDGLKNVALDKLITLGMQALFFILGIGSTAAFFLLRK